jgi:FMN phosphatase YigB (HAD superfamily)
LTEERNGLITNGSVAIQANKIEQYSLQNQVGHITISETVGVKNLI